MNSFASKKTGIENLNLNANDQFWLGNLRTWALHARHKKENMRQHIKAFWSSLLTFLPAKTQHFNITMAASRQSHHFPTILWTLGHAGLWLEIQLIGIVALQHRRAASLWDWGMGFFSQTHRKVWKSVMVHKARMRGWVWLNERIPLKCVLKLQNMIRIHINMLDFSSAFCNQR